MLRMLRFLTYEFSEIKPEETTEDEPDNYLRGCRYRATKRIHAHAAVERQTRRAPHHRIRESKGSCLATRDCLVRAPMDQRRIVVRADPHRGDFLFASARLPAAAAHDRFAADNETGSR